MRGDFSYNPPAGHLGRSEVNATSLSIAGISLPMSAGERWRLIPSSLALLVLFLITPFLCTPPQVPGAPNLARGGTPLQANTPYEELPVHEIIHAAFVLGVKAPEARKLVWLRRWGMFSLASLRAHGPSHASSWLRARNTALPATGYTVAPPVLRGPPSAA